MNNKHLVIFTIATSVVSAIFLTNAGENRTPNLTAMRSESRAVSLKLQSSGYSTAAKQMLRIHKERLTDYISFLTKPTNCRELIQKDPHMISGRYTLFRANGRKFLHDCLVSNGMIQSEAIVGRLVETPRCVGES